jgi:hypothetical protein
MFLLLDSTREDRRLWVEWYQSFPRVYQLSILPKYKYDFLLSVQKKNLNFATSSKGLLDSLYSYFIYIMGTRCEHIWGLDQ